MYVIIWEFRAKTGREADFERVYGPDGEWTEFFKRGEGYLGTELLRDTANPSHYLTIDRWASSTAYEAFRRQWVDEYVRLDKRGEALTEHEALLGCWFQ